MRKQIKNFISLLVALGLCAQASATIITDLYGDKDGFGIGVVDGATFDFNSIVTSATDPAVSDRWILGDATWSHTYDLTGLGPIVSAGLEIFTGGQGWFGESRLYLDNVLIGVLTDGDGFDTGGDGQNRARKDTYDLGAYIALLNGSDTLRIDTFRNDDGWVLDYSELTIETASVPEPTILSLVSLGLLGMGFSRRRRGAKFF